MRLGLQLELLLLIGIGIIHEAFTAKAPNGDLKIQCFDFEIDYPGMDIGLYRGIWTAADCQQHCQTLPECQYWTHRIQLKPGLMWGRGSWEGLCWLKHGKSGVKLLRGVTSGPRNCECNVVCDGGDSCCNSSNQCDLGEGDCDNDNDCKGNLVCSNDLNNCQKLSKTFGSDDDCCAHPACSDCVFPFKYVGSGISGIDGKIYNGCTKDGDTKYWCPTSVDNTGTYISGSGPTKWKYCNKECPSHVDIPTPNNDFANCQVKGKGLAPTEDAITKYDVTKPLQEQKPFIGGFCCNPTDCEKIKMECQLKCRNSNKMVSSCTFIFYEIMHDTSMVCHNDLKLPYIHWFTKKYFNPPQCLKAETKIANPDAKVVLCTLYDGPMKPGQSGTFRTYDKSQGSLLLAKYAKDFDWAKDMYKDNHLIENGVIPVNCPKDKEAIQKKATAKWEILKTCNSNHHNSTTSCTFERSVGVSYTSSESTANQASRDLTASTEMGLTIGIGVNYGFGSASMEASMKKTYSTGYSWTTEDTSTFTKNDNEVLKSSVTVQFTGVQSATICQPVGQMGGFTIRSKQYTVFNTTCCSNDPTDCNKPNYKG